MHSPESVSHSILKVDEVILLNAQQVTSVEVQVSFPQDVMQPLLLRLLQVSHIPRERSHQGYFRNQESRLTCS